MLPKTNGWSFTYACTLEAEGGVRRSGHVGGRKTVLTLPDGARRRGDFLQWALNLVMMAGLEHSWWDTEADNRVRL